MMTSLTFKLLAASATLMGATSLAAAAERVTVVPASTFAEPAAMTTGTQTAVLAGGCFWGVQGVFQHVKGVKLAVSGYTGGPKPAAGYEDVSTGETGHAESVKIEFDPKQVTYGQILQIYFSVATDPTELNFQGPDEGTQYRSDIFYGDANQKAEAEAYIAQLGKAGVFKQPIVTRVDALGAFYKAEAYHQDFATRHPNQGYIAAYDIPKIEGLQRLFPANYREQPEGLALAGL